MDNLVTLDPIAIPEKNEKNMTIRFAISMSFSLNK
jgi:hypothetical protein